MNIESNIDGNLNELNELNELNNEIIYDENTDLSSEEELLKPVDLNDNEEDDENVKTSTSSLMDYCNINNIMIAVGILVLLYFLFKDQVDGFISDFTSASKSSTGLCN